MQPKAKDKALVTSVYDATANTITYTSLGAGSVVLHLSQVADAVKAYAMIHGFGQRVPDAAAVPAEPLADTPEARAAQAQARAERKLAGMARIVEHYNSGADSWTIPREGGTIGLDPVILAAVAEFARKPVEAIRAMVEAKAVEHKTTQRAYLARLGAGPKIAPIVDRMRGEQAPGVDIDADLDELTSGEG